MAAGSLSPLSLTLEISGEYPDENVGSLLAACHPVNFVVVWLVFFYLALFLHKNVAENLGVTDHVINQAVFIRHVSGLIQF